MVPLFRLVALLEALSWLGLLVGMYLKYVADAGELGVQVFGPIHGGLFVGYVGLAVRAGRRLRWPWWTLALGLVAAVPPFATVLFERWAARTGRLEPPTAGRDADALVLAGR